VAAATTLVAQWEDTCNGVNRCATTVDEETMMLEDFTQFPEGLPRPEDDGAAAHLVGKALPGLRLASTSGETVALDQLGSGRTVLFVYPMSGRPGVPLPEGWDTIPGARGCTTEAVDFRDHHGDLTAAGASVLFGVSSQDSDYQRELVERLRLPFALLSDVDLSLAETLHLPTFTTGGLKLFKRLTLVVRDHAIEHVFYPVFPPNQHAQQVLDWLTLNPPHPPADGDSED
jgi:peroxiredoxin